MGKSTYSVYPRNASIFVQFQFVLEKSTLAKCYFDIFLGIGSEFSSVTVIECLLCINCHGACIFWSFAVVLSEDCYQVI